MEVLGYSETLVFRRATQRTIPEDGTLHSLFLFCTKLKLFLLPFKWYSVVICLSLGLYANNYDTVSYKAKLGINRNQSKECLILLRVATWHWGADTSMSRNSECIKTTLAQHASKVAMLRAI
jgi:hypothetical protein